MDYYLASLQTQHRMDPLRTEVPEGTKARKETSKMTINYPQPFLLATSLANVPCLGRKPHFEQAGSSLIKVS